MNISVRSYNKKKDFNEIGEFLVDNYTLKTPPLNWCQQRWENMHFDSLLDKLEDQLNRIGVWRDNGKIISVAHFEHEEGKIYFEVDPKYSHLKKEMLEYAEKHLSIKLKSGKHRLCIYINDLDSEFTNILSKQGYNKDAEDKENVYWIDLEKTSLEYTIPNGFKIQSLADENDLSKVNRVLHRGFNHKGEPPKDGIKGRKKMQSAPNYRKDLTIVAVNPKEDYVSFAGSWYDTKNMFTYVDPVATDPDYRKMGLGKACVLETMKRSKNDGANIAIVGSSSSSQDFYKRLGFKLFFTRSCWVKCWDN